MESISQAQKGDKGSVYGTTDTFKCGFCKMVDRQNKAKTKVYCSKECKDAYHNIEREAGKKALTRGKIHAALLENSPRLQRAARLLSDGKPHSTRDIIIGADVCAVSTVVGELKDPKNGFDIECERRGEYWYYTMIGGETQLLRLV